MFYFCVGEIMEYKFEKYIEQIKELEQFIPGKSKEEMAQILAYWEKIKAEWEKRKQKFWSKYDRKIFIELLEYKRKNKKKMEWKYEYLGAMKWMEREKFIEEYLHDDILYGGKIHEIHEEETDQIVYDYDDLMGWKIVMKEWIALFLESNEIWPQLAKEIAEKMKLKEWVELNLSYNEIWDEWVEAISHMELKEWVNLFLIDNQIWDKWAEAIAENLKLKDWVTLDLSTNQIWEEWAKAIAENLKLKDWVFLNFYSNQIWEEWTKAIAENLKLKEWVILDLWSNQIWDKWAEAISHMELKEWVVLNLGDNEIWNDWAENIMKNMTLKNGVTLDLRWNNITYKMEQNLKAWEKSYHDKWINCKVVLH